MKKKDVNIAAVPVMRKRFEVGVIHSHNQLTLVERTEFIRQETFLVAIPMVYQGKVKVGDFVDILYIPASKTMAKEVLLLAKMDNEKADIIFYTSPYWLELWMELAP